MTSQTEQMTTVDAGAVRTELLARLGLPADATDRDVETLHRAAVSLVDNAPEDRLHPGAVFELMEGRKVAVECEVVAD